MKKRKRMKRSTGPLFDKTHDFLSCFQKDFKKAKPTRSPSLKLPLKLKKRKTTDRRSAFSGSPPWLMRPMTSSKRISWKPGMPTSGGFCFFQEDFSRRMPF